MVHQISLAWNLSRANIVNVVRKPGLMVSSDHAKHKAHYTEEENDDYPKEFDKILRLIWES